MTRARSHLGVVVLVFGALLARPSAFQDSAKRDRTYSVGVVRADGTLIPFAQFDRGTWRAIWSGPDAIVPLTLDDVEERWWGKGGPALSWMLWKGATESTPLKVTRPRVVSTPCSAQAALGTDYETAGTLPEPDTAPYPKLGIATTSAITFEPIVEVPQGDPDWQRVKRALEEREFREAEDDALADMSWRHPAPPSMRERTPIDLQAVWHVKDSRFFYFEAMKHYPDPEPAAGKPPCELVTYVAGYLWEDKSEKLKPVNVRALITYCHMEFAAFLWPFGVIREGDKQYWLFQSAGWSGEFYGITEPMASRGIVKPHVVHVAGRCR